MDVQQQRSAPRKLERGNDGLVATGILQSFFAPVATQSITGVLLFGIFNRRSARDPYLERVAAILNKTLGPVLPNQNAYDLASECLDELKANIARGMFRPGGNPREVVMAYYSLCSMVRESGTADDKGMVLKISIMAQVLGKQLENQSGFTPLEIGICQFGAQTLSEAVPKHSADDVAKLKTRAAEILVSLAAEQGESVATSDMRQLIENVASNIGERDVCKAGDRVLALSALANVTAYSIDQGEIRMANVYSQCFFAAVNKFFKDKMETLDNYQGGAVRTIIRDYSSVVKELMQANSKGAAT